METTNLGWKVVMFLPIVFLGWNASAQIFETRIVDGKTIECVQSGLEGYLKDCGLNSKSFAYVFVGTISAISPADKNEKKLRVVPEEVFYGDPANPLFVLTAQGDCFEKLSVGERWLFFLLKEEGKPIILGYGSMSSPIEYAQKNIETLRRLKFIGNFGILRGEVLSGDNLRDKGVADVRVMASRKSDNSQFFATTNADGYFEFDPLPPGKYDLQSIGSFRVDDESVQLDGGACWDVEMKRSPDAQIAGHVKYSDGSPVAHAAIVIIRDRGFDTIESDADGYFHSDDMRPGKYVIGMNLPDAPAWKYDSCAGSCEMPPVYLYYPGLHDRSNALTVTLGEDEKRDDIDFTIPNQ